jgi:hypothetical protein
MLLFNELYLGVQIVLGMVTSDGHMLCFSQGKILH